MSESYPHFEFESHDDKGEKSPKRDRPAGKIERPIGRMATPLERRIPLKPLSEFYPKQEKFVEVQKPLPSASEYHVSAEFPNWRRPETGELAAIAEQAHRARFEAALREHAERDTESKETKATPANGSNTANSEASHIRSAEAADGEPDRVPHRLNDASLFHTSETPHGVSNDRITDNSPSEYEKLGPGVEQNPQLPSDNEADFQAIVNQPELSDLAAKHIPETPRLSVEEQARPTVFDRWVRQAHPELSAPEMAAASNPDEGFNDIVRQNYGNEAPTSPTRYHEQAPGEPPIDMGHGGGNLPPNPPTAEGGAWGSPSAWEQPAGGLGGPAALAGMSALEARRRLDNLRHTAAELTLTAGEAALAGAVGILGLALAAEHIRAKHREKKLSRQLEQQNEELSRTNQTLAAEQVKRIQTRGQLDRLSADRLPPAVEVAAGVGLADAAAANAEHVTKSSDKVEMPQRLSDQELAHRLKHSRELGRAIQHNPEMRNTAQDANNELRELVGASAYADSLKRERNYEHLQTEPADIVGQARSGSGTDVAHSMGLPQPGAPVLPSPQSLGNSVQQYQNQESKPKAIKPIAATTVLVVVVLILIFIFR